MKRWEAKWIFCLEGWHKANFDRVAKGNPGLANYGGIIKIVMGAVLQHFLSSQSLINHFLACHIVKLALASGIENLWLEGDSLNIINHSKGYLLPS